jgi:hypothetical protein
LGWVFYCQPCLVVPVYAAAPGAGNALLQHRFRIRIANDGAPEKSAAREAAPAPEVNVVRGRGSAHLALLARHRRHLSQKSTRYQVLLRRAVVGRLNCCISGIFRVPGNNFFLNVFSRCCGSMTCVGTDPDPRIHAPLTNGSGSCYFRH